MIELLLWSALTVFSELAIVRMFCTLVGGTSYFGNLFLLVATFVAACGLMAPYLARHARWIAWALLPSLLIAIGLGQFNLAEVMPGEFFWSAVARVTLRAANFDLWLGVLILMLSSIVPMLICGAVQGELIKRQAQGGKTYLLLALGGLLGGLLFALQNQLIPQLISLLLVWSALVATCLWYRLRENKPRARGPLLLALAPLLIMLAVGGVVSSRSRWSPYHRVDLMYADGGYSIMVNGFYICSVSTEPFAKLRNRATSPHVWSFKSMRPGDRVLVVGSCAGSADVREALHAGASEVTAAEIEPAFIRIGNDYDPDRTYRDPKVNLVNTDGRQFLSATDKKFDFVYYPFVDSHATASNRSRFRLDSFLYTVDGLRLAYSRVAPNGVLVVSFATFTPWIAKRMYDILAQATGAQVRVFHRPGSVWMVYAVSKGRPLADLSAFYQEAKGVRPSGFEVPTDDWPFFYSIGREVPPEYLRIAAMVMMLFWALFATIESATRGAALRSGERAAAGRVRPGLLLYAFFSGAAFFFIELRTISALAPVFGSTYLSQSLAIIGIISCSLGGALAASRWPLLRARWVWMALFVLVAASGRAPEWFHPHWGSVLQSAPVLLLALLLPVFCAGYLYFLYVRELEPSAVAAMQKWNLIGGAVGGLTESSIILLGFQLSVWVAALFYLVALIGVGLARGRGTQRTAPHPDPAPAAAAVPGE